MNLHFQLQTLKKGNSIVDEYFLQMRTITDGLLAAGHSLSDDDLVIYVLGGLGVEFDDVVVSLTGRDLPSLSEVHSILHIHEMRLQQSAVVNTLVVGHSSSTSSVPHAHLAIKDGRSRPAGGYKGKRHFSKNRVVCQLCGKTNHVAAKCYKRFDTNFQGLESNSRPQHPSSSNFQAHLMHQQVTSPSPPYPDVNVSFPSHASQPSATDWFVDSGASHHEHASSHYF